LKKLSIITILIIVSWFYTGCSGKNNSPEKTLLQYREYSKSLVKTDLLSISKSLYKFKELFTTAPLEFRDSAFVEFRSLFYNVINNYSEIFWNNAELMKKVNEKLNDDPMVKTFKSDLDNNGLRLSITEGSYYIDEKPDYLINNFKSYVSPGVNEFLKIRSSELMVGFSEDAALLIPFRELGGRIITWQNYINKYPSTLLLAEAKFSYHLYLNTFLSGLDNSPIAKDDVLLPEVKEVYSEFINKYRDTESGKIVEKFYNLLSGNNFRLPEDLDDFYKENQIESMTGMQPPTR
jgi:hypothetical protein